MLHNAICLPLQRVTTGDSMKTYLRLVLNVVFIVASFGYVLPLLISYPDTLLVLAGFAYALLLVPGILYYANRNYLNNLVKSFKENF